MTRYRCLVLDHDDTSVQSTPTVHYPAYVETIRRLRPQLTPATREEFTRLWFESRFMETCRDVYHFTPEEMQLQDDNWKEFMQQRVPEFFDGLPQIIRRQRAEGGLVCVVSHSYARYIRRDYAAAGLPEPNAVLGWEIGAEHQKPSPEPLERLMQQFDLTPADILVVDDLKPGFDMARAAGCDFIAAQWGYPNGALRQMIAEGAQGGRMLETPAELYQALFGEEMKER